MKYLYIACRVLLALVFILSGADKLFHLFHMAMPPAGTPQTILFTLLISSGWLKLIGLTEFVGGLLVLFYGYRGSFAGIWTAKATPTA